jgi:arylsulfotransferase ASST
VQRISESLPVRAAGRRLLWGSATVMGSVALVVSLAPGAGAAEQRDATAEEIVYQSNPDILQAPALTTTTTGQEDPGLLLTTPGAMGGLGGAAIYDNSGELVWYGEGTYSNLQEIVFQGEPALAGLESNRAVVLDSSYTEVASFSLDGYDIDFHSLAFNDDGSRVLLTGTNGVGYDLSEYGGSADATVIDVVVQELNTETGEVTFQWQGLDHVPVDETQEPLTGERVDYLHANSIAYDTDGDILMSARHTSTVYKIDPGTGEIVWRFGGESSDFTFDGASEMPSYQHDASRLADGRLAVFDNGVGRNPRYSRGSVWEIDEQAMTADLALDLQPEEQVFAEVTGSSQQTANGNQLVNYGNTGQIVEFSGSEAVFTATFPDSATYKAERTTDFVGTPASSPDVAWSEPEDDGSRDLYMSWNGATEVESWRVETGSGTVLETVEKTGFETEADVTAPENSEALQVSALDADGEVLSTRTLTEGVTETITE